VSLFFLFRDWAFQFPSPRPNSGVPEFGIIDAEVGNIRLRGGERSPERSGGRVRGIFAHILASAIEILAEKLPLTPTLSP
jgi:hypothetical protein